MRIDVLFRSPRASVDEETGLYYFGARYYDPRTSVWQSPDPILGRYLNGKSNGGVFVPKKLALYGYTLNNPVVYTDPDGLFELPMHRLITQQAFAGWAPNEIARALEGVTRVDTLGVRGPEGLVGILGPLLRPGQHFDFQFGPGDSRDTFASGQLSKAVNFLRLGQREEAAGALGEGLHSIQDKWAHSFLKKDASGNMMRREVGWWEHLGRNILGAVEEFFTGENTFSPDSPDSANFAERRAFAEQESNAYVQAAEAAAKEKAPSD